MSQQSTLWTIDELTSAATAATGLDDFGAPTWQEGLQTLLDSIDSDAPLNDIGKSVLRSAVDQFLTNRLQINDWYGRHPEIANESIRTPLFNVGMVRTGTTALSFLLDQDPGNRSLLHWFAMQPCPPPVTEHLSDDPRITATEQAMGLTGMVSSDRSVMELLPDGPAECLHLLSLDFRSGHFEGMFRVPSYHDWLFGADLRPAYEWHLRALKLLQWRAPTQRWILKYPSHTIALDALIDVYPDARFVVTHRDPATSIASVCSLCSGAIGAFNSNPDPLYVGRQWTMIVEQQLRRMVAVRDTIGDNRFFDIDHHELVRAPMETLEGLYEWLGAEITPEARRGFSARIESNPNGAYGVHRYDPATYGLDVDELHERFTFYTHRFRVPLEKKG
jgi:hypothetical protein